ncbi:ATP-binding protein [Variovorax paradoxus]|uniref:ATP-binding protein n=1 Tax=Variovorax paradoxus TaxID=34073 RepID=UPI001933C721|nr:response regulator [Variovorax paradoxus]
MGDDGLDTLGLPAADPARQARVEARVRERQADQVLAYLRRLPYSYAGFVLVAVIGWRHGLRLSLPCWLSALAVVTFLRCRQGRRIERLSPPARAAALPVLLRGFLAGGLLNGAILPFVFMAPGDDFAPLAVSAILILVLSVGADGVAGSTRAFASLSLPPTLLMSLGWFLRGTPIDVLIGFGPWLAYFLLLAGVRDRARTLHALMEMVDANLHLSNVAREERDRARELSAAKTRFLAAASHDLRQPLHAISLFGAALEHELGGHPAQANARRLMGAVRTLDSSLDAMLDISQLDAGVVRTELRPLPLQGLFERVFDLFEPRANQRELELRVRSSPLWVRSDAQLLQRLLGNLVDNALKYTERGGVVVRARARGDAVWLEVRDTGIGIAEQHRARVFDEFYQAGNAGRDRSRGLGVGLSIVQRIAALLAHPLVLRTREGRGTCFRLVLPAAEAPPVEAVAAAAAQPWQTVLPPLGQGELARRVLVLDDDADARAAMVEVLRAFGVQAASVDTEAAALAALREAQEGGAPFEAALCDWRLRDGEDGLAAAQRLRAADGGLHVLMVTGETDPLRLQALQASGLPVLFKPVEARQLVSALVIDRAIGRAAAAASA